MASRRHSRHTPRRASWQCLRCGSPETQVVRDRFVLARACLRCGAAVRERRLNAPAVVAGLLLGLGASVALLAAITSGPRAARRPPA